MTDDRSPFVSKAFAAELAGREIVHLRTPPFTPRTDGKAEALVKT